jgi:hypothetical protein
MKHLADTTFVTQWRQQHGTQGKIFQWSWFKPTLLNFMAANLATIGLRGELDETATCALFFDWVAQVEHCEAYAQKRPIDHAHFICGRLLCGLLRTSPFRCYVIEKSPTAALSTVQQEWPEGFLALSFVCTLLEFYRQELGANPMHWNEALFERHWRSFRENVGEDTNRAGPFLDFFLGLEPIWEYPTLLSKRPALEDTASSF